MGRFVNPDNSAFQTALNSRICVDKTGMIEYMNRVLDNKVYCSAGTTHIGVSSDGKLYPIFMLLDMKNCL